jgi:hypothetical protein
VADLLDQLSAAEAAGQVTALATRAAARPALTTEAQPLCSRRSLWRYTSAGRRADRAPLRSWPVQALLFAGRPREEVLVRPRVRWPPRSTMDLDRHFGCASSQATLREITSRLGRARCVPDRTVNQGDPRSLTDWTALCLTCIVAAHRIRTRCLPSCSCGWGVRENLDPGLLFRFDEFAIGAALPSHSSRVTEGS